MAQSSGNNPPPKPWERAGASSGSAPFKPPSPGSTSDVVEASGTAKPGEIVSSAERNASVNMTPLARPVPTRPWEQNYGGGGGLYGGGTYGGGTYGGGTYGSVGGTYGSVGGTYGSVGGYGGSSYGGGMYGSSMYNRGGYGGGSLYGGSGMYGGGMYSGGMGRPMGGYGMGMGGPYGDQDPNNPYGAPPSPPGFWISFLRVMQGVVTFFGRVSFLIDQNAQAFHMFMSALLQLFEHSGMLYGELARFVFRLLGIRTQSKKVNPAAKPDGANYIEGPKAAAQGGGNWDSVWGR